VLCGIGRGVFHVETIETPGLGDRSYVADDGAVAVVVDPQRDIDRVRRVVDARGVRVTHVLETHVHNDYVSGGLELARTAGAEYVLAAAETLAFDRRSVRDGDELHAGSMTLRVLRTPGHTPEHLSYLLLAEDRPEAVFTGGCLLFGTVGRTDLLGQERADELSRAQYGSVRRLLHMLPDDVAVHPTHGFGSFCASASGTGAEAGTVGEERRGNLASTADDEEHFVGELLGGLTAHPGYYAHMAPINRAGPPPLDLSPPPPVDAGDLRRRIRAGGWVVDVRGRRPYAQRHLTGTVNVQLADPFATYLGWAMPWGTPITLVGDDPGDIAQAQRAMARIGIHRPAGEATGGVDRYAAGGRTRSYRVASFADLAERRRQAAPTVLDVRRDDEWADGHIRDAVHVPLDQVERRLGDLPGDEVWVHCASGYRAAIAASLVDRTGKAVVLVDDEFTAARDAGLEIVSP